MMTGALRLVGELKQDTNLGTESMRDILFFNLVAGQEGVLWLEIVGGFLMLSFPLKLLVR